GRVALYFRDRVRLLAPHPSEELPHGEIYDALREHLRARGASFWTDLFAASGVADQRAVLNALWDLVWAGEVTNDTLAPLRSAVARKADSARPRGARPRPGALRRAGPPAAAGRWSLVGSLLEPEPSPTEISHARALQLLERHGVVTREAVLAEGVPGGFSAAFVVLQNGSPAAYLERGAKSLLTFEAAEGDGAWIDALIGLVKEGRIRKIELQRIDGVPAAESPLASRLHEAGFAEGYKGLSAR